MLKRLRAQYHFLKALGAWKKDDWAGCLGQLQRAENLRRFGTFRAAFKAQDLIALRQFEAADQIFSHTLDALGEPRNARDRYVQIAQQVTSDTLSSDGLGIPRDERDNVLKRFYRLDSSRTKDGVGLGLALASAIADLHGAQLRLSDARPGLSVTITWRTGHQT